MSAARLYYTDAYRTGFEARVVACEPRRPGETGFLVRLDATAFYPASGGQPCDTGLLGGTRVLDVIDEDGETLHVTEAPLAEGASVDGRVDWPRRFDHMQQHTGQHLLSAAFDRLFDLRTESVHLGADASTLDLAREASAPEIDAAVGEANRVIWENRPVTVRFVTEAEAAALPLRKPPARAGHLRLVDIENFDLSACGGTHVARTGAVGIVTVTRTERVRGGSRVEFLCGDRVRRRFDLWRDTLAQASTRLSVAPADLATAIARLQDEMKAAGRALQAARERLAAIDARALVERGTRTGNRLVVAAAVPDADAAVLKAVAVAASREPGAAVALVSTDVPPLVVVAAHPAAGVDAGAVLRALAGQFGGRGGGRPDLAQGGGLDAPPAVLLDAARALLSR